jgi:protein-L-isoaspartate(D-aspartate) O-methyltransferase
LGALGIRNVVTRHGDGWRGWPEQAPFDRIIVTAAPGDVPAALVDQLAEGGIMVIPVVRDRRDQTLVRIRKQAGSVAIEDLASVRFVPMVQGVATDGDAQSDPGSSIRHSA